MSKESPYVSRKEKQEQIKERLISTLFLSDRAIAKSIGCSHVTVGTIRTELINSGELKPKDISEGNKWYDHPFVEQNPGLFADLNIRQLRAVKRPGVIQLMQEENLTSPIYAMRKLTKRAKIERENAPYSLTQNDIQLHTADIKDGLDFIEDGSVKAIICDPPYSANKYLDVYEHLSKTANRILTPDGVMAVMVGQANLHLIMAALCTQMRYWWQIAYLTPGCSSHLVWMKFSPFYKPILIFVRQGATYQGKWMSDVIKAEPDDHGRTLHKWQQSTHVFENLIDKLSEKGDLVCDPFLGSGTTAWCCAKLGRKFVGSDIDPKSVDISRKRVEDFFKEKYAENSNSESEDYDNE